MGSNYNGAPAVDDDDDEGFSATKWVPASQRENSTKQELEEEALERNSALTQDVLKLKRITEDTKGVASQTLVTLKDQGEQIDRIHGKAVQLDQKMEQNEKLLNKLGGLFTMPWKPKKGKKITGPRADSDAVDIPVGTDRGSRAGLGLDGAKGRAPNTENMSFEDRIKAETNFQDEVLDEVSENLKGLKDMAHAMGKEMDRQDKHIDDLGADVSELNNRMKQDVKRAHRLLGRR